MRLRLAVLLTLWCGGALAQAVPPIYGPGAPASSNGGNGTVTNVSGTPANGISCTTTNPTTTPVITCSITPVGLLKSNGTTTSVATAVDLPATPLLTGTSTSLVGPRQYYVCTGTCTVTPPVPVAGYEFCVQNDVGVSTVITMAAIGSSARYGKTDQSAYGTAGTGTFISGGAAGDKICLLGKDATHYNAASFAGTWAAN